MIVVHNPLDIWVPDSAKDNVEGGYPIKDADGEVKLWRIGPGETLEFPDNVGKYLLEVYGFLQEVMTEDQQRVREEEKEKIREGKVYSQVKIVEAKGEVVGPVTPPAPGFTNETLQPHNAPELPKPEVTTQKVEKPGIVVCPEKGCGQEFKGEHTLKMHYASKHLVLPTA